MDDQVIDLVPYLQGNETDAEGTFAVFGGGGSTSRFALPVWRAVYLLEGDRGGILALDARAQSMDAIFVLDLGVDPARTDFDLPLESLTQLAQREDRIIRDPSGGWLAVCLGGADGVSYFLVVTGALEEVVALEVTSVRQDFMFLAGECAGLLFHWGLAEEDREA